MCIQCNTGKSTREIRRQNERLISRYGWTCQSVMSSPTTPGWAYTIGLEDRGHPELIVVGRPAKTAYAILEDLAVEVVNGAPSLLAVGKIFGHSCGLSARLAVLAVDPDVVSAGGWFNMAIARRGGAEGLRALQLVWSDPLGNLPTETTERQPLLGDPWWSAF